jgi:hypothetical protein
MRKQNVLLWSSKRLVRYKMWPRREATFHDVTVKAVVYAVKYSGPWSKNAKARLTQALRTLSRDLQLVGVSRPTREVYVRDVIRSHQLALKL